MVTRCSGLDTEELEELSEPSCDVIEIPHLYNNACVPRLWSLCIAAVSLCVSFTLFGIAFVHNEKRSFRMSAGRRASRTAWTTPTTIDRDGRMPRDLGRIWEGIRTPALQLFYDIGGAKHPPSAASIRSQQMPETLFGTIQRRMRHT